MEFKSVSWIERYYKAIDIFGVILTTFFSIMWFVMSDRSAETAFLASLLCAFVFYLISSFSREMSARISNSFIKRVEVYKNYKRAERIILSFNNVENTEPLKINNNISWSLCFFEKPGSIINGKHYVRELGIKYHPDFLETEQQFREAFHKICGLADKRIRDYVSAKGIKSKKPYFTVDEKTVFDPEDWCKDAFDDYQCVLNEIERFFEDEKDLFETILDCLERIRNYYSTSLDKCRTAIGQIEKLYGNKLFEYIDEEKWHIDDVETIKAAVSDVEASVDNQLTDLHDSVDSLKDSCEDMRESIDSLSYRIGDHFEEDL